MANNHRCCDKAGKTGSTLFADISEDISHIGKMEFRGRQMDKVTIS